MYASQSMSIGLKGQYIVNQSLKPMMGSQGQVYFGIDKYSQQEVAIKLCVLDDNEKHFLSLYMEKKQQKTPQNLVNIFEFYQQGQNNQFIIIMERANCGDLQTFLKNSDYLKKVPNTKQTRIQFLKDIATGVKELHEMGIIHRDIKPENILVFSTSPNQFTCKICDFGLAKKADNAKTQQIGTPYYMAPELLQLDDSYTNSVDIWALGCLFYEILSEQTLFNGKTIYELMKSITQSTNQHIEQRINEGLKDCGIQNMPELISKMVKRESQNRINIKEVMTYIYSFKGIVVKIQDKTVNQGNQVQQFNAPNIVSESRIKLKNKQSDSQQKTENPDNCQDKQEEEQKQQVEHQQQFDIKQQFPQKQIDQMNLDHQMELYQNPNIYKPEDYNNQNELLQSNNLLMNNQSNDNSDQKIQNENDCGYLYQQQGYQFEKQKQVINHEENKQLSPKDNQNCNLQDEFNQNISHNQQNDCGYDCQVDKIDHIQVEECSEQSVAFNLILENLIKNFIQKIFHDQHMARLKIYLEKLQTVQNLQNLSEMEIKEKIKPYILEDMNKKLQNFTFAY